MQDERSIFTVLQKVRVSKGTSRYPNGPKQGSAFPPNYIHSLDSTHMMMTALKCKDAGGSRSSFCCMMTLDKGLRSAAPESLSVSLRPLIVHHVTCHVTVDAPRPYVEIKTCNCCLED